MRTAAIMAAMVVPSAAWAAQEQPAPQMAGVAQAAVTGCAQAHALAERTIDMTNRRVEAARQANSPAAMRAAMDDLQAALRQLRTDIAPCAGLQSLAAANPQAGHVMPGTTPAPAAGTPAAPAPAVPAPGAAGHPAGHVMPAAPQTPATAPRATTASRPAASTPAAATPPRSAAPIPAAAAPQAGHVMPGMPAGHVMPATPQAPAAADTQAGQAMTTPENPAARLADLMCQSQVDANTAPRATYMGKAYYFCTNADRDLFLKTPARFLQSR